MGAVCKINPETETFHRERQADLKGRVSQTLCHPRTGVAEEKERGAGAVARMGSPSPASVAPGEQPTRRGRSDNKPPLGRCFVRSPRAKRRAIFATALSSKSSSGPGRCPPPYAGSPGRWHACSVHCPLPRPALVNCPWAYNTVAPALRRRS